MAPTAIWIGWPSRNGKTGAFRHRSLVGCFPAALLLTDKEVVIDFLLAWAFIALVVLIWMQYRSQDAENFLGFALARLVARA